MLEELGKNLSQAFFVYISICTIFNISGCDGTSKLRLLHKLRYTFIAACVVEL